MLAHCLDHAMLTHALKDVYGNPDFCLVRYEWPIRSRERKSGVLEIEIGNGSILQLHTYIKNARHTDLRVRTAERYSL